jgi:hypothetical protein
LPAYLIGKLVFLELKATTTTYTHWVIAACFGTSPTNSHEMRHTIKPIGKLVFLELQLAILAGKYLFIG